MADYYENESSMLFNTVQPFTSVNNVDTDSDEYESAIGNAVGTACFAQAVGDHYSHSATMLQFNEWGNGLLYVQSEYADFAFDSVGEQGACSIPGCNNDATVYRNTVNIDNYNEAYAAYLPECVNDLHHAEAQAQYRVTTYIRFVEGMASYATFSDIGKGNVAVRLYFGISAEMATIQASDHLRHYDTFALPNALLPIVQHALFLPFTAYCDECIS